jgi:heme/copper-type cytochrome/quinol oxidase subunit 3
VGVIGLVACAVRKRPSAPWAAFWHFVGAVWLVLFVGVFVL